jgi:hypothetical protein
MGRATFDVRRPNPCAMAGRMPLLAKIRILRGPSLIDRNPMDPLPTCADVSKLSRVSAGRRIGVNNSETSHPPPTVDNPDSYRRDSHLLLARSRFEDTR